jgi:hypothetical protein
MERWGMGKRRDKEWLFALARTMSKSADKKPSQVLSAPPASEHPTNTLDPGRIETYIAAALTIALVVFDMTWWLRAILVIILCGIVCDSCFRHPRMANSSPLRKWLLAALSTSVILCISWRPIRTAYVKEHLTDKSVLTMHASMTGAYGPDKAATVADVDINNPVGDAISELDLTIKLVRLDRIVSVVQEPTYAGDCQIKPVPLPSSKVVIGGQDGRDHLTLDSQDALNGMNLFFRWKLHCQRMSEHSTIRIELTGSADIEHDAIHMSGTYELIPSEGAGVVKVDETIPIAKI